MPPTRIYDILTVAQIAGSIVGELVTHGHQDDAWCVRRAVALARMVVHEAARAELAELMPTTRHDDPSSAVVLKATP